jgi:hypothetical protein
MRRCSLFLSVILLLILSGAALACPMCKDSLTQGDSQGFGALPNGFNTSIELMLGGFLATVGLVAGIIWKAIREG